MAMSLQTPEKIRTLQKKLYLKAKAEPVSWPLWVLRGSQSESRVREIRMHGLMSGDGRRSDGSD